MQKNSMKLNKENNKKIQKLLITDVSYKSILSVINQVFIDDS